MAFKKPGRKELKRILGALRYFGSLDFLEDYELLLRGKEVFAISKDLARFIENVNFECLAGVKLGEVGSRRFRFSLEGAFWLVRNDRKKVWVNERGEMLFLYGRDIFASSIEKCSEFGENEIVFVCNRRGDIIGIGRSRFSSDRISELPPDRVAIENLVDRGAYIRHEKLYEAF